MSVIANLGGDALARGRSKAPVTVVGVGNKGIPFAIDDTDQRAGYRTSVVIGRYTTAVDGAKHVVPRVVDGLLLDVGGVLLGIL